MTHMPLAHDTGQEPEQIERSASKDWIAAARKSLRDDTAAAALDISLDGLARYPDHPDLIHEAANAECALGRYSEALDRIDAGLTEHRFHSRLLMLRARIAHFAGEHEEALALLDRLDLVDPHGVSGTVLRSRCLNALDRGDEAWEALATSLRFRPRSQALLFNLARRVTDADSLAAFHRLWLRSAPNQTSFVAAVRPMSTASLKARAFDNAIFALRRGIQIVLEPPYRTWPKAQERALGRDGAQALVDVVDRLNQHKVPHFLAAGTVLGLVREGRLLSFDNDIDIGIPEDDFDRGRLLDIFAGDVRFRVQETDLKSPKIGLQHWSGVSVDLFKFYSEAGKIWHAGAFTRWWNTPFDLTPVEAYGRTMLIPAPTDLYLQECYGDWRTPCPEFDAFFEGPNAEIIWSDYFRVYLHRRVFELLTADQGDRARWYVERFPDHFDGLDPMAITARDEAFSPRPEDN